MFRLFTVQRALISALFAALLGTAGSVSAFTAPNGTRVNPVDDVVFEAVSRGAASGRIYWCAAADYARRALGASWDTSIYIVRGRGPSVTTGKRSAVQFTIYPQAAGIEPGRRLISINSLAQGENMTVQRAHTYCQVPPSRF